MTRDIQVALFKDNTRPSCKSLMNTSILLDEEVGSASSMATPGGFRRTHVLAQDGITSKHAETVFMEMVQQPTHMHNVTDAYESFILATLERGSSRLEFEEGQTPLLWKPAEKGASVQKTVFTLLKSFVGSGILFLPKGFENGGLGFSISLMIIAACLSTFCMLRLSDIAKGMHHKSVSYGKPLWYGDDDVWIYPSCCRRWDSVAHI